MGRPFVLAKYFYPHGRWISYSDWRLSTEKEERAVRLARAFGTLMDPVGAVQEDTSLRRNWRVEMEDRVRDEVLDFFE